ncbi:MAG: DUF502 domain-containing protein [Gemmatimonadaceae bacterium]
MGKVLGYFARGLVLVAPLGVTLAILWFIFTQVDGWLGQLVGLPRGAGFVATIALITLIGFLGSSLLTRSAMSWFERALSRLPFVRLLYGSTKDLLNAFVGEKRRFDKAVMVALRPDGPMVLGFLTQESLAHLGLTEHVAVYCPHSYAFSGQLYVVPSARITVLDVASADAMAFVVSGGVAGLVPSADSTGEYAAARS